MSSIVSPFHSPVDALPPVSVSAAASVGSRHSASTSGDPSPGTLTPPAAELASLRSIYLVKLYNEYKMNKNNLIMILLLLVCSFQMLVVATLICIHLLSRFISIQKYLFDLIKTIQVWVCLHFNIRLIFML